MAQPRTARLGLGFLWGVVGFSLIGIIAVISKSGDGRVDEYEQQRAENRLKTRLELEEAANKKLSEYAWVNKEKGIVGIPIDRAMELTVADLQTRTVGASDEKAVIMPTLLVPPAPEGEKPSEAAEAPEGETKAAPTDKAPATEAAPTTEAAPAAGENEAAATPADPSVPAAPAETPAGEAAPATPEAPSEP